MESNYIITGSSGFLGSSYITHLKSKSIQISELDFSTPIDLNNEDEVVSWFSRNKGSNLINFFGINDHISSDTSGMNFLDFSIKDFRSILFTNVASLFLVCREFIKTRASGTIVNISSIYSVVSPNPTIYGSGEKNIAYGVSKAAVNQLGRHLAVHAAPNFRINTIALGGIRKDQPQEFIDNYSNLTPLGRMGEPQDLFGMIDYLSNSDSGYVTGATFILDGGWTCL